MCLVIDANVFSSVFNGLSSDHAEYEPVLAWITQGRGFIVYSGSKYKKELAQAHRYLQLFIELRKQGKVVEVNAVLVDQHEVVVNQLAGTKKCNDAHIIAIFRVSGCRLLCSNDQLSDKYIKNPALYLKRQKPPLIYRSVQHVHLLRNEHIVRIRNAMTK
jgi:predicted nucleic acid-binding protein